MASDQQHSQVLVGGLTEPLLGCPDMGKILRIYIASNEFLDFFFLYFLISNYSISGCTYNKFFQLFFFLFNFPVTDVGDGKVTRQTVLRLIRKNVKSERNPSDKSGTFVCRDFPS